MRSYPDEWHQIVAALDEQTASGTLPPARVAVPGSDNSTWPGIAVPTIYDTLAPLLPPPVNVSEADWLKTFHYDARAMNASIKHFLSMFPPCHSNSDCNNFGGPGPALKPGCIVLEPTLHINKSCTAAIGVGCLSIWKGESKGTTVPGGTLQYNTAVQSPAPNLIVELGDEVHMAAGPPAGEGPAVWEAWAAQNGLSAADGPGLRVAV